MTGMEKRVHSICKQIRLTPQEAKELAKKAAASGMTESSYMRLMISQKPNDYPEIRMQLRELINEVNHIGNNINQIAKSHNAGFSSADDKGRLFAYMKRLNTKLNEAVEQIGNQ